MLIYFYTEIDSAKPLVFHSSGQLCNYCCIGFWFWALGFMILTMMSQYLYSETQCRPLTWEFSLRYIWCHRASWHHEINIQALLVHGSLMKMIALYSDLWQRWECCWKLPYLLFRLISSFKGDDCKIAKLFAKHIKVSVTFVYFLDRIEFESWLDTILCNLNTWEEIFWH